MTSPSSLPPIEVGTRLTDFAALDLIVEGSAEGGFGLVVWGHNQAADGQMTALKLLRPDLLARANAQSAAEGARMRREFEREALTWCHLWPHADIIAAAALTRLPGWDNLPVLVLEYAPNGNLRQMLSQMHSSRTGHLSLEAALAWGQQIAAALAVIHQPDPACERPEPLIHCDLKPQNVLLDAKGWAKLTDLGLTRAYAATDLGTSEVSTSNAADIAIAAHADEAVGSERDERLARMRAALQAAGLLSAPSDDPAAPTAILPAKGSVALETRQETRTQSARSDPAFSTRSMRIPPLSAAMLATILAPRPFGSAPSEAAPALPATPRTHLPTEPGIGSRGPVAGTPPYMPPEQWWGLDAVAPASDVYALGVLLFELFTGGAWSPQQQRWLSQDQEELGGRECYVPFPHAPQFEDDARLYAETGIGALAAQQAYFATWYAAHRAGPRYHLHDVAVGALSRGPLAEVADQAQKAQQVLMSLSELVAECLAPDAEKRPTANSVQRRLAAIAQSVAQEPLSIPDVYPRTSEHEAEFWENLGITYGKVEQSEERLRLQRRVVTLDPENPQRWMNLGAAYNELRRNEEALEAYTEAEQRLTPAYQRRNPQRAALVELALASNRGIALRQLERYAEAVAAYRRVLALRPDWADTRFNLSVALHRWSMEAVATREQRLERLQAARQELHRVLTDAPNYEKARALLADVERALARLERE